MRRKRAEPKPLKTIWEVSDELWARIEPILKEDWKPSPRGGQPPADWRRIFNGIVHRLRSGCQWNQMPKRFGDDSTMHRWFQRWCRNGVMKRIWALLVEACDELDAVHWEWQEVSDELWAQIEPILKGDWKPSPRGGQPPADWRRIFNGIIHRLRSGCQWNRMPERFGDDST